MTRRLPPSQRDRDTLAAALRQTDRLARSQAGPGFYGGRLALPQPVPGSGYTESLIDDDDGDEQPDTEAPIWEDRDRHRLTSTERTAGYFRHQLLHTDIVEAYEFTVLLNGVALDPSRYSLDPVAGIVVVTLTGWERPGYRYRFLYAYTGAEVDPLLEPVPVSYVVAASAANGPTSIAFPAGVQAGDIAIAVAFGRIAGNPRITDARFTVHPDISMAGTNRVVIGTWVLDTASPTPAGIIAPDLGGVQDGVGMLYVVRPSRPIVPLDDITDSGDQAVGGTFSIPGFDEASGGVAILCTIGGIGGAYGWGLSGTNVASTPSSYGLIYASLMDYRPEVPDGSATPGIGTSARGFMVGLGLR